MYNIVRVTYVCCTCMTTHITISTLSITITKIHSSTICSRPIVIAVHTFRRNKHCTISFYEIPIIDFDSLKVIMVFNSDWTI